VSGKPFRGFESHPLRQTIAECRLRNADFMKESSKESMKSGLKLVLMALTLIVAFTTLSSDVVGQSRRRARRATICGNPKLACKSSVTFQPYDLPFRLPQNAVIWESENFYAVILKSMKVAMKEGDEDCAVFIPETDRLAAQEVFPDHKVFTSRCAEPGQLFYTNTSGGRLIMAVYAGATAAQANRFLANVKASGQFPGAYLKRMRAGFNGT
jgi:hypothetical protein